MPTANTFPAKRFFVDMFIRDIELKDALLDLLDNCVDGAMRTNRAAAPANQLLPYAGYRADIQFDEASFRIQDNCGGIPLAVAERSAFRLGRPDHQQDPDLPTVGFYGIGMKRAIFKLGSHCKVSSYDGHDAFTVEITPDWLASDDLWELPIDVTEAPIGSGPGTRIEVTELRDVVARSLATTEFEADLIRAVEVYYGYIIEKGFRVNVNGVEVRPKKIKLLINGAPEVNRPAFCRHLGAIINGNDGGVCERQAIHG